MGAFKPVSMCIMKSWAFIPKLQLQDFEIFLINFKFTFKSLRGPPQSTIDSWPLRENHQNVDSQNPDWLDIDGLDIDGQLFWAVDILSVNRCIIFDKKVECFEELILWFWVEMLKKVEGV